MRRTRHSPEVRERAVRGADCGIWSAARSTGSGADGQGMTDLVERLFGRTRRVPVTRPMFIVGCGRSGTAPLFNLLGDYPP